MGYLNQLGGSLVLGDLLNRLVADHGKFELIAHWMQGEFHHDIVLKTPDPCGFRFLVVATNCNGGVKELLAFDEMPARAALWEYRLGECSAESIGLRNSARTLHWFDPRELLGDNARSELKPEYRSRQPGGGWRLRAPLGGAGTGVSRCSTH